MSARLRPGAPLLAALALGACAQGGSPVAGTPAAPPAETIAISVGPCFGFCPVYDSAIAPDGTVRFSGKRHTALIGDRQHGGDAAGYRAIAAQLAPFRPASGTTAPVECGAAVSDTSGYTITWTAPDGTTTVATHRLGCPSGPGQALDTVLATLPARLGIADWAKQTTRPDEPRG